MRWKAKERAEVYESLKKIDAGFAQAREALEKLMKIRRFDRSELAAFSQQCEEARACATSYVTEVIAEVETQTAANLQRRRLRRERTRQSHDH
jgi:hypothetical protein